MKFNTDYRQILPAIFFFITVIPMTFMAIHGFSSWSETVSEDVNSFMQILVQIWVVSIIPITFYIMLFSKFHNPFKEKIE